MIPFVIDNDQHRPSDVLNATADRQRDRECGVGQLEIRVRRAASKRD
jgi:hypothetical protein